MLKILVEGGWLKILSMNGKFFEAGEQEKVTFSQGSSFSVLILSLLVVRFQVRHSLKHKTHWFPQKWFSNGCLVPDVWWRGLFPSWSHNCWDILEWSFDDWLVRRSTGTNEGWYHLIVVSRFGDYFDILVLLLKNRLAMICCWLSILRIVIII